MKTAKKTAGKTATKKTVTKKPTAKPEAPKEKDTTKKKEAAPERDETQYKFNGETLGKGRFLLAMVHAWVKAHPKATEKQLEEAWPHNLIHRYGVFAPLKEAKEKSNPRKRYYIDEKDVFELCAKKYAVCNQITAAIIEKVLEHTKQMGLKVK